MRSISTLQFPVHVADRDWTFMDVHEGAELGTITLTNMDFEHLTVPAGDVHRNLYSVRCSFLDQLITGSFRQPLVMTWAEAEEMVERLTGLVGRTTPAGTTYTIEVAR